MVDCSGFLDRYSEYRDGLLGPGAARAFRAHLEGCAACLRHDRAVTVGVEVLWRGDRIEASAGFGERLRDRLLELERENTRGRRSLAARPSSAYPYVHP